MNKRTTTKLKKTSRQAAPVALWSVVLCDGDWYWVFAKSARGAVRVVIDSHYDTFTAGRFAKQYGPTVRKIKDAEQLVVNEEHGQRTRTAGEWREGQKTGPFVSNTYEI